MGERTEIGRRIFQRRRAMKLTQQEAADIAQMAAPTYAGIENGDTKEPGARSIAAIATALQLTADYILGLTEELSGADRLARLLPPAELALLQKFRSATKMDRARIETAVDTITNKVKRQKRSGASPFKDRHATLAERKTKNF